MPTYAVNDREVSDPEPLVEPTPWKMRANCLSPAMGETGPLENAPGVGRGGVHHRGGCFRGRGA